MAFIKYVDKNSIDPAHQVDDDDNILQIHGVHSQVIKLHSDLYVELMHRNSPLSREQREMIAVMISAINQCHY